MYINIYFISIYEFLKCININYQIIDLNNNCQILRNMLLKLIK